jgi:DNA polymerase-3 subunit epsilon
LHGALLDSEILAEVYLELIGGRQPDFGLATSSSSKGEADGGEWKPQPRPNPLSSRLSQAEAETHKAYVAKELGDAALWLKS